MSCRGGRTIRLEYRFLAQDGAYRWMHDEVRLVRDADGKPVEIAGAWMDITGGRRMEQELQETHSRLQTLIQATPLPIVAMDREGCIRRGILPRSDLRLVGSGSHRTPQPHRPPDVLENFRQILAAPLGG